MSRPHVKVLTLWHLNSTLYKKDKQKNTCLSIVIGYDFCLIKFGDT